jgi:hypothetical protein
MTNKEEINQQTRGWLPKEPCLRGNHTELGCGSKQPPLVIHSGYNTSATQSALALTVVWVMLDAFLGFFAVEIARDSGFFPLSVVLWIISGIAIGVFSGVTLTRKIVKRLSKSYEYHSNLADVFQFSFPVIIFSLAGLMLIWLFQTNLLTIASLELLVSTYALCTAKGLADTVLFSAYEKRENMQLMQKTFGSRIIAIPNPPSPLWNGNKAVDAAASQTKEAPSQEKASYRS